MKIVKYLTLIFFFFFLFLNVDALEQCTTKELSWLRELASNVEFKYDYDLKEYEEDDGKYVSAMYHISIINDTADLKYNYKLRNNSYTFEVLKNQTSFGTFDEGEKITINVIAYTRNLCSGKVLLTKTISLPYYNDYYYFNKDICTKYSDFSYCDEFVNTSSMTEDEINEALEDYKNGLNNENNIIKQQFNYKIYVLITCIVILLIGFVIFIIIKKSKGKGKDDL